MRDFKVRIESIKAGNSVEEDVRDRLVRYKADVSLTEKDRSPGYISLGFHLELNSVPSVGQVTISGSANLTGGREELRTMLASSDGAPPPVIVKIYERVYSTLYLLCDALMLPSPLPNLMKQQEKSSPPAMPSGESAKA